jgi:crotonobetainyl-CoA:carnitine CoA-transferase CaiB-like acyl-CoA transferase
VTPVRSVSEAMQDPLFRAREMVLERNRETPALGVPVKLSATPGSVRTAPAAFGEHTDRILGELGYRELEIEALRLDGVV